MLFRSPPYHISARSLSGPWLFIVALATPVVLAVNAGAQSDGVLRLNHIQVIATHNSYHVRPRGPLYAIVKAVYPDAVTWNYSHAPLDIQLDRGLRSFELDVYYDPRGFKVMHVPAYDRLSTCPTFAGCLEVLRGWSERHPRHVPVLLLVELKDEAIPMGVTFIRPIDGPALEQLDREVRAGLPADKLITPAHVRGDAPTLSDAIREKGWPTLEESRGKFLFVLHTDDRHLDLYANDSADFRARPFFMQASGAGRDAVVWVLNNPHDPNIPRRVKEGCLVRTRADSGLKEGWAGDTSRRDAALASGAHVVSTDFPPGEADKTTGYFVQLPGGIPARCNPLNAPPGCIAADVEPLEERPQSE